MTARLTRCIKIYDTILYVERILRQRISHKNTSKVRNLHFLCICRKFDDCQWLIWYVSDEYVHRLRAGRWMDKCTIVMFSVIFKVLPRPRGSVPRRGSGTSTPPPPTEEGRGPRARQASHCITTTAPATSIHLIVIAKVQACQYSRVIFVRENLQGNEAWLVTWRNCIVIYGLAIVSVNRLIDVIIMKCINESCWWCF